MSGLRDILLIAVLVPLVPMSLVRPWLGVLAWFWIAYFVPHSFTWGFGRTLPVALLVGGATLAGFIFTRDRKPLPKTWTVFFMALFLIHITVTTVAAFNPEAAWGKWDWVAKSLLMTFVTMCLFQDRDRLRWLYLLTAVSLGMHGLKGGLWVLRTGGGNRVYGPEPSFFMDNNTLGLALCMTLPILLYLSRDEPRPWLKRSLRVVFAFSLIAIIFTYSRGAFLGLVVVLAVLVWRSPWRLRFAAAVVVAALLLGPLVPEQLRQRIESITEQDSTETRDSSTEGRIEAWRTAWNIASASPFLGAGFRALWHVDVWDVFYGGGYAMARDAHSLYFEVLGEHGFLGLALYLLVLISTLATLRGLRRRWRDHPEHGYLSRYAEMTQLALYPFLVSGAFLGVAYFDLYFLLVATTVLLKVLSTEAAGASDQLPAAAAALPAVGAAPRRGVARPQPGAHTDRSPRHA